MSNADDECLHDKGLGLDLPVYVKDGRGVLISFTWCGECGAINLGDDIWLKPGACENEVNNWLKRTLNTL